MRRYDTDSFPKRRQLHQYQEHPTPPHPQGPPGEDRPGLNIGCVALMVLLSCAAICAAGFAVWSVFFYQPLPRISSRRPAVEAPAIVATPTPRMVEPQPTATFTPEPLPSPTEAPAPPTNTPEPSPTPAEAASPVSEPPPEPEEGQPAANPAAENPGPASDERQARAPAPPGATTRGIRMNSPEYGMQAFLWWRAETADRDLNLIREAGFGWVKQIFGWRDIEGAGKGVFDWSRSDRIVDQVEQYGLNLIARIDNQPQWAGGGFPGIGPPDNMQDFADFLFTFASRYKGRIRAYQVWNEPNLAREWGERPPNPAEYTAMLKAGYEAIKRADPEAMVISAGMAPTSRWDHVAMPDVEFVKGMYAAGAKPYFDVLGVHGAGYKVPPETDPAVVANDPVLYNNDPSPPELRRLYCFRHVEDLRQVMVENGDADKQVALLEFGWTSDERPDSPYHWHAVTEEQKADYLVRAYRYAKENWTPWIGVMSLIYMPFPEWTPDDEKWWWAVIDPKYPELHLRPAYVQLKEMSK